MKYQKTLPYTADAEGAKPQAGQWVKNEFGQRGQWLGVTKAGAIVIRWQNGRFSRADATANKHLRGFAKTYGSK